MELRGEEPICNQNLLAMEYRHYYCTPKPTFKGDGYYGTVSGIKNAKMIEAATVDEFEEEFHRYVDEYLREYEEKKGKKTRRTIVWCSVLAVLFISLIFTCPDKQKHVEALNSLTSSILNDQISEDSEGWEYLGAMLGNKLLGAVFDNNVYVDNYVIFSIGKMTFEGEDNIVSFGIFNHVFTKSREQVRKEAKENKELNEFFDSFK